MKVAAIGRTEMLYDSILKLEKSRHQIALIITCKESPAYRILPSHFRRLAKRIGVDFMQTQRIDSPEAIELIKKNRPDLGISVNWCTLIGQDVLNLFPLGIINAHAGDLPRYRGNAAPNWAIICGERKIVLCLHLMTPDLDAGPILLRREFAMSDRTYISEVYEFLNKNVPEMFLEAVNGFASNSITPVEQPKDLELSLRGYPRIPEDGEIYWSQPAVKLDRLVRAVSEPFPGAYTFLGTEKLIIWRAHNENPPYRCVGTPGQVAERRASKGEVAVVTGEGFLVLEQVQTRNEGRKRATEIIKTIRTRLGMDLTREIARINEQLEEITKIMNEKKIKARGRRV